MNEKPRIELTELGRRELRAALALIDERSFAIRKTPPVIIGPYEFERLKLVVQAANETSLPRKT